MTDIVVVGGGGHAKVVIAALLQTADLRVVGYTDAAAAGAAILGVSRLGGDDALKGFVTDHPGASAAIGVGMVGDAATRREIEALVGRLGLGLPVVRARTSVVLEEVEIARGAFLAEGVVVNPSARIGRCVILNTSCTVEHDAVVGDHTHVAPGAIVCGGTSIGEDCWIGAGAVVAQSIRIAPGCIVGAGSVVVTDLESPGTYVGIPARRIR